MSVSSLSKRNLGTIGHLAIFACFLASVMIPPAPLLPLFGCGSFIAAWLLYPRAVRSLIKLRWALMIAFLSIPPIFLLGVKDHSIFGISYSLEGLAAATQIAIRIMIILISVQGLTNSIDIASVAGLLEHAGLHGLGFSMGVALNLLPALLQSAQTAWRSLWMRGGLRKKRWRGLRLLAVTIIAGALNRAEEIALAAEARAFSPEKARIAPVKIGKWDWGILCLSILFIIGLIVL